MDLLCLIDVLVSMLCLRSNNYGLLPQQSAIFDVPNDLQEKFEVRKKCMLTACLQ